MDTFSSTLAFMDGLGAPEMVLIFVIVLILFGGQKLPEFARGLGKSIREFKKAAAGVEEEFKRALEEDERRAAQAKLTTPVIAPIMAPAKSEPAEAVPVEPEPAIEPPAQAADLATPAEPVDPEQPTKPAATITPTVVPPATPPPATPAAPAANPPPPAENQPDFP
jgi:sec-independent protein translocase protein TatA